MRKDDAKKVAIGAAIAGAAGYVAGILTAPKSGKETRADIKRTAAHAKSEAEKKLKKLHSELMTQIEKAKRQALRMKSGGSKDLNSAVEKASNAKEKVRNMLSTTHEGGADDAELQKTI